MTDLTARETGGIPEGSAMDDRLWQNVLKTLTILERTRNGQEEGGQQPLRLVGPGWRGYKSHCSDLMVLFRGGRVILRRRARLEPVYWLELAPAEFEVLAGMLERWGLIRHSWHGFESSYGIMGSYLFRHHPPQGRGEPVQVGGGALGYCGGRNFSGKNTFKPLCPPRAVEGGFTVTADIVRTGEEAVQVEAEAQVGEVYHHRGPGECLECHAFRFRAEAYRGSAMRRDIEQRSAGRYLDFEPGEAAFLHRVVEQRRKEG